MSEQGGEASPVGAESQLLTRAQHLIWSGQQLQPDAPLYNMAFVYTIAGALDADLFSRAFARLVDRTDALRTVIVTLDGVPRQRVETSVEYALPLIDLSEQTDPEAALLAWSQSRCEHLFDLAIRTFDSALIRLADDRYAWYLCQHHVVCDAWSMALIFDAQDSLYRSLLDGAEPADAAAPAYADFVTYERQSRETACAARYWRDIRDAAPIPPILYGRKPSVVSTASRRVVRALGHERSARMRALAGRQEARSLSLDLSLFNLFATLLFAYLHRVAGQQDIAIAAPAHNRSSAQFKRTVGLFTEMYPLHTRIEYDDSFVTLLQRVALQSGGFLRHASPGACDPRNNAGCNTVLNYIKAAYRRFAGLPVDVRWLHPGHKDREHHLRLQVHDFAGSGEFELNFDFNTDVFDAKLADRAADHFVRLLDALLDDWAQPIGKAALLSDRQRHDIVSAPATKGAAVQAPDSVLDLVDAAVAAHGDRVAISCRGKRLNYRALSAHADVLARQLDEMGQGGNRIAAIHAGRSIETVVAILGVLRAGWAYLPVLPDWPRARVDAILEDAAVAVMVGSTPADAAEPDGPRRLTVDLDMAPANGPRPRVAVGAGDLAYVMYTSGSTGRPKGVKIRHGSLANYVHWAARHYAAEGPVSMPLFTPVTFDLTVTSLFVPLVSGGTVVVYPQADADADLSVIDVFDEDCVDVVKLTPAHLALVQGRDLRGARISQLILGGEDLGVDLAARTHAMFGGDVRIHNEYGPTEGTVGCILHSYDPHEDTGGSVPIGRPIQNMQAWILDRFMQVVPAGVAGELFIAGRGLAAGYLNRTELTDERFVAHPCDEDAILYRTGDLARLDGHGRIEYLGREDEQVKIRGARIELGEIEAAMAAQAGVESCAVTVFDRTASCHGDGAEHCTVCGLSTSYPGTELDEDGVCDQCRAFERYRDRTDRYFRPMDQLRSVFLPRRSANVSGYDCMALLSGGKDSTYMLCRLVDMGLKVFAFTLDNGFISPEAKQNIRRVVSHLGVDHEFASTPAMNEIFVDSLRRHANVCQGCFKTIYTLSINLADRKGIPYIVTGLSRGQFFETRLTEQIFTRPDFDVAQVDETILQARKAYHRVDDAVNRLLDVEVFSDDAVFERVRFVDFYRYCEVALDEVYRYLEERVAWVRPSDTGRSTNCLINDVGIYIHKQQRGYHNYALPYSWDVRMGHKTREAALAELDDDIDTDNVQDILQQIGYREESSGAVIDKRLVAYYQAGSGLSASTLRVGLKRILPDFMMPSYFVRMERMPLSANGKIDRAALPPPDRERPSLAASYVAPGSDIERSLSDVWHDVLRIDRIGIQDNFFDLGGDSIMAIQIVARARKAGLVLLPAQIVDHPTIAGLAAVLASQADMPPAADQQGGFEEPSPAGRFALADLDQDKLDKVSQLLKRKQPRH